MDRPDVDISPEGMSSAASPDGIGAVIPARYEEHTTGANAPHLAATAPLPVRPRRVTPDIQGAQTTDVSEAPGSAPIDGNGAEHSIEVSGSILAQAVHAMQAEMPDGAGKEALAPYTGPPSEEQAPKPGLLTGITRNVVVLGVVSFFTDVSSEMIVPVRILFLVVSLHTPLALAGLIEGVAESTASLIKVRAGRLSDQVSRRKPLIIFGYGLSNLVKPMLALVTTWPAALGFIFLDRVGKGVRGSPRDAIMADSTPPQYRGKAFGFHRSMDTLGAAVGPLLTYLILLTTNNDLRSVFAWTAVPGVLSILVVVFFLRERRKPGAEVAPKKVEEAKKSVPASSLGTRFWMFTAISTVFALGNSSDAFIFLRSADLEQSLVLVPLLYFGYNFVYSLLATPLGALSDRFGRLPVLISGYAAFGLVYAGWALATQAWNAWALFLVYGVYSAATEGVAKAFVTDMVPKSVRGTAMGWYNGMTGVAALPANLISGWLWAVAGPTATFAYGAWVAGIAVALTIAWIPWLRAKSARASDPSSSISQPPHAAVPDASAT